MDGVDSFQELYRNTFDKRNGEASSRVKCHGSSHLGVQLPQLV